MNYKHDWKKNTDDLKENYNLRLEVFSDEQKFDADIDIDEYDEKSNNETNTLSVYDSEKGILIGNVRLVFKKKYDNWYLSRVCVKKTYRGLKIGDLLMSLSIQKAKDLGIKELYVSSQLYIRKLYEKHGFVAFGDIYLEEGAEHISLSKKL